MNIRRVTVAGVSLSGRPHLFSPHHEAHSKPHRRRPRRTPLGSFPQGQSNSGGAPANFAYMTSLLGDTGIVASRVGSDALGRTAGRRLSASACASNFCRSTRHPTGTVKVAVDPAGQPTFNIIEDVAWDFFEWTPEWQTLASTADAVCFGSLAQRSPQSRDTIRTFLQEVRRGTRASWTSIFARIFTPPRFWRILKLADIIKLNHDELPIVVKVVGVLCFRRRRSAEWLRETFGSELVCVTRGAKGSLLVGPHETISQAFDRRRGYRRFRRRLHRRTRVPLPSPRFPRHDERSRQPHGRLGRQPDRRHPASRQLLPPTNPQRHQRRRIIQKKFSNFSAQIWRNF